MRLLSVFAVLVVAFGQTAQDDKVLADAAETVQKYCSVTESLPELDIDKEREDLEGGAGEDNFILTLIEEAGIARQNGDNADHIADRFAEITDPGFVAGKAFAVVLSIFCSLCCGSCASGSFAALVAAGCVADAASASGQPEGSSKEFSGFFSSHSGLPRSSWFPFPCLVPPVSITASLAQPARRPSCSRMR